MFRTNPLFSKLAFQLLPAALITSVGVLLLSNLATTPEVVTEAAPVEAAINGEAVFKAVPREAAADEDKDARRAKTAASNPKQAASGTPLPQPRKPTNDQAAPRQIAPHQVASAPPPLPIVTVPEQPPAAASPVNDTSVMGRLRSATTAVQQMPQRAARSVSGWFADSAPPRPPASVPMNYRASM